MKLVFFLDKDYRENIKNFKGKYLFRTAKDIDPSLKQITVHAIFNNGKMKVDDKPINNADVTLTFKNAEALRGYVLSRKPDILNSLLKQDVIITGNLNYLFKFAYMAKHLQMMFTVG